jgi:hypothetical protein
MWIKRMRNHQRSSNVFLTADDDDDDDFDHNIIEDLENAKIQEMFYKGISTEDIENQKLHDPDDADEALIQMNLLEDQDMSDDEDE